MWKTCMVPYCTNNTTKTPGKLFIRVPRTFEIRKAWFDAVNRNVNDIKLSTSSFCCEDHFQLPEDAENWQEYLQFNRPVKIKKNIIPRINKIKRSFEYVEESDEDTNKKILKVEFKNKENIDTASRNDAEANTSFEISPVRVHVLEENISSTQKGADTSTSTNISTSSPSFSDSQTNISETTSTTSDTDSDELQKISLKRTLSIIKKRPRYYIGILKDYEYIVDIIATEINVKHHHVLLCLKKIRRNTPFSELADDFGCSESYASKIFSKTITLIYNAVKDFVFWPEKQIIKKNLPIPFRYRYYNVQSIIDRLEIQIEKPSHPEKQSLTWSQYKDCNTLKYLVSMTPDGFCNFISDGYSGRITDQHLIEVSNFLNILPLNCTVMGDRGFKHIDRLLLDRGCTLIRPPSVLKDQKLDKKQVKESKEIAALRIHVERLIRRFREFLFLSPHATIDHNLIPITDKVIKIVAALINLQSKL